jgi:hypothetical protein
VSGLGGREPWNTDHAGILAATRFGLGLGTKQKIRLIAATETVSFGLGGWFDRMTFASAKDQEGGWDDGCGAWAPSKDGGVGWAREIGVGWGAEM